MAFRWYRFAQPPANSCDPSGIIAGCSTSLMMLVQPHAAILVSTSFLFWLLTPGFWLLFSSQLRYRLQQLLHNHIGRNALALSSEVGDEAVAEDGAGHGGDIVGGDVELAT
jgi:hypothetical protein